MARWRDVKQGNIKEEEKRTLKPKNKTTNVYIQNASLMDRFKAFITDTFMITMPLLYIVFYFIMGSRDEFSQDKLSGWLYFVIPHFILIFSLWFFKQQTPGMKAYNLKIVDSYNNNKPSIVSLINRYIQTSISVFLILPLFYPFINKQKRTFQDIVSATNIINVQQKEKDESQDNKK